MGKKVITNYPKLFKFKKEIIIIIIKKEKRKKKKKTKPSLGIFPKHLTFFLHWTNERCLRRTFIIRWTNDRQTDRKPILSCLGLKTCFSFNLRLMIGLFFFRFQGFGASRILLGGSLQYKWGKFTWILIITFSHSTNILCIKMHVYNSHQMSFYYCELYFVKMYD
jgi:hypothetical protein